MPETEGSRKRLDAHPDLPGGEIVLYSAPDGTVKLDVRLENETIWLSQKQMSLLFGKDSDTIGLHIRNMYKEGELKKSATTEESSVVQNEGGRSVIGINLREFRLQYTSYCVRDRTYVGVCSEEYP